MNNITQQDLTLFMGYYDFLIGYLKFDDAPSLAFHKEYPLTPIYKYELNQIRMNLYPVLDLESLLKFTYAVYHAYEFQTVIKDIGAMMKDEEMNLLVKDMANVELAHSFSLVSRIFNVNYDMDYLLADLPEEDKTRVIELINNHKELYPDDELEDKLFLSNLNIEEIKNIVTNGGIFS